MTYSLHKISYKVSECKKQSKNRVRHRSHMTRTDPTKTVKPVTQWPVARFSLWRTFHRLSWHSLS